MNSENTFLFECLYHCEIVRLEWFDEEDKELFLSIYHILDINNSKNRRWENFKRGIKVIFGKEVLFGEVVMSKEDTEKLSDFLNKIIKRG